MKSGAWPLAGTAIILFIGVAIGYWQDLRLLLSQLRLFLIRSILKMIWFQGRGRK
jgi:hypothetical protein